MCPLVRQAIRHVCMEELVFAAVTFTEIEDKLSSNGMVNNCGRSFAVDYDKMVSILYNSAILFVSDTNNSRRADSTPLRKKVFPFS